MAQKVVLCYKFYRIMKLRTIITVLLLTTLWYSCGEEDSPIQQENPVTQTDNDMDQDPEPDTSVQDSIIAVDMAREEAFELLTGGSNAVWRIENAELINENGTFDITENFNIKDDEFIFSVNQTAKSRQLLGSIEWRPSYDVVFNSGSSNGSLVGRYQLPVKSEFEIGAPLNYVAGEPIPLRIEHGENFTRYIYENWTLTKFDNGSRAITGGIVVQDQGAIQFNLIPKDESDYKQIPSTTLEFSEIFTFKSNGIDGFASGMVGSLASNSMYIAMREGAFNNGTINPERVIRFDLGTNTTNEKLNFTADFVSKELQIVGDKLYVAGGQRIHAYDLDLMDDSSLIVNYAQALGVQFLGLSRFGTAVSGDDFYIVGGDLENNLSDKVFKYNTTTQTMTEFATLPESRSAARAEIVNNKLYIFGGTETFFAPPSKDTIYIVDLVSGVTTIETLPTALDFTFTGKIENLIYVAGAIREVDIDGLQTNREPYFGVYDTRTGVFTTLETNLESPGLETIQSMAVFDGKIYVIFGQGEELAPGELQTWSIMEAIF